MTPGMEFYLISSACCFVFIIFFAWYTGDDIDAPLAAVMLILSAVPFINFLLVVYFFWILTGKRFKQILNFKIKGISK